MSTEILCTLGPSSLNDWVIARFEEIGVSLFRVNLSHTKLKDLPGIIQYVKGRADVPICLDTEGAQVRTGNLLHGKISLRENSIVRVQRQPVPGDPSSFNLYPNYIVDKLEVGDFLTVDSTVLARVIETKPGSVAMQVLCGGEIGQNKAVTVERDIVMPAMTEKDLKALAIGKDMGVRHVALSFANRASDVDEIRALCADDASVISKIECRNALKNLDEIAARSDALLIDRGDLSRQVPIEQIPAVQKQIIAGGKKAGKKVYVATNLMESMITQPTPTRAEANDVYNTLADGADGLVLAAESAIGKYPVGCASMVLKIIHEFNNGSNRTAGDYPATPKSLLVAPHGGSLVQRRAETSETRDLAKLKSLTVKDTVLADCEQIAHGVYSPLTGFMGRETLKSVLDTFRLPNGLPWPMPVLLQIDQDSAGRISEGERIALRSRTGQVHAFIDINEIFSYELPEIAEKWFGTTSRSHPGVTKLSAGGSVFVGGDVTLVEALGSPFGQYKLTPAESRYVFTRKGWSKMVGVHVHTVSNRAAEFMHLNALESTHADGLYVSVAADPDIVGGIPPELTLKSYQLVIDFDLYPNGRVVLGCSSDYPRYCGPREVVFTALCYKNMGCDRFIVDGEYGNVGDFYSTVDARKLFEQLGDIGVEPIFYDSVGFDPQTQSFHGREAKDPVRTISGSELLEAFRQDKEVPDLHIREVVQEMLRAELTEGRMASIAHRA